MTARMLTLWAGLLYLGATAGWSHLQERLERRPGFRCDAVTVKDGQWSKGASYWMDEPGQQGISLRLGERGGSPPAGTSFARHFLNYNHRSEDPDVLLSKDPGPGTEWKIEELPRIKNRGGFGYRIFTKIRPAQGPMREWWLTLRDDRLVLTKDPNAAPAPIYAYIDDLNDGK